MPIWRHRKAIQCDILINCRLKPASGNRGRNMPILKQAKRIVVKVGTSTLTYEPGKTNIRRMAKLVSVLSDLLNSGMEVVLVTSGAIGVGVGKLGLR